MSPLDQKQPVECDPLFGLSVPEKGWVPAPSFLLRRDRILRQITGRNPGSLIEIGCGAGTLLRELSERGFTCEALETSEPALEIARHVAGGRVRFHESSQSNWTSRFDYLLAFEVLEHIENDCAALADWWSWLRPGGLMLMSVPARMSAWTASDLWAGHYRRYERQDLITLIVSSGFEIEGIETYGFPLANIISPLRAWSHARQLATRRQNQLDGRHHNNDMSGVERAVESRLYPLFASPLGRWSLKLACALQAWTVDRDWGNGYLVTARKAPGLRLA